MDEALVLGVSSETSEGHGELAVAGIEGAEMLSPRVVPCMLQVIHIPHPREGADRWGRSGIPVRLMRGNSLAYRFKTSPP